jgi:hypothetical protein
MDLKEFVKESLIAVVEGVQAAQQDHPNDHRKGALIGNPEGLGHQSQEAGVIDFDVAVAVDDSNGSTRSAGAKIVVVGYTVLDAGARMKTEQPTSTSISTRLKCAVPVVWPGQPESK